MISVLMGLHCLDDYIYPAIDSVLGQLDVDFELIIIANGAESMRIQEVLKAHYANESRLTVVTSPVGQLSNALNIGLAKAKYDYVARMDGDDIARPERLSKQLRYLLDNNLDVVGTAINLIDSAGLVTGKRTYPSANKIRYLIYFKSCFCHPTILAKKKTLIDARGYNSGFNSEDYDLWLRLHRRNVNWDNMVDPLLDYRIHGSATQGNVLGYAESAGYMLREFILSRNPLWLFSTVLAVFKAFLKGRS